MNLPPTPSKPNQDPWLQIIRRAMSYNESPTVWPEETAHSSEWKQLVLEILELRDFIMALANGDLSNQLPVKGQLAGSLKALQASLRHLSWQVQQVANGDYSQQIDFMGEFSSAFNAMTVNLDSTHRELRASEERYRRLVDADPDAILILDLACQVMFISPNGLEMFGYACEEELLGQSLLKQTLPRDVPFLQEQLSYSGLGKKLGSFKINFQRKNASIFPGEVFVTAINDDAGAPAAVIAVVHNITERVHREEELHKQHTLAEALRDSAAALNSARNLDQVLDVILTNLCAVVPHDGADIRLIDADQTVSTVRLSTYDRLTPGQENELLLFEYPVNQFDNLRAMARSRQPLCIPDVHSYAWVDFPNQEWIRSYLGAPIIIAEKVVGFISLFSEEPGYFCAEHAGRLTVFADQAAVAIQKARLFEDLQHLAITDGLTGLWNRRHFFDCAEREFAQAQANSTPLALLILDIDHFKQVNDTFGHLCGDQVLAGIGQVCLHSMRKSDLVGRYGGEEFIFLLPDTGPEEARFVAERLRSSIAQNQFDIERCAVPIRASIGIANLMSQPLQRLEQLIDQADQALYSAKLTGRNCVQVYPG